MKLLPMLVLPAAALPSPALPSRETLFSVDPGGNAKLEPVQNPRLKDISGMSYVGNGTFITVHDMKYDEEASWPRVSLVQLPYQLSTGLQTASITDDMINWPTRWVNGEMVQGPNDLESVAGIPGQPKLALLCESTNSRKDKPVADKIYLAEVDLAPPGGRVSIKDHTSWSNFTFSNNVEATAVARVDGGYLFLWGERDNTTIHWADLTLEPNLAIGPVRGQGSFSLGTHLGWANRPVVGLDVDDATGAIYLVSSFDLGSEHSDPDVDADNGPYRSATSYIGLVERSGAVHIFGTPQEISYQDGFKVETVAHVNHAPEPDPFKTKFPATFIGTDDENYGGTLRKVQLFPVYPLVPLVAAEEAAEEALEALEAAAAGR